jgi:hypothetical protein
MSRAVLFVCLAGLCLTAANTGPDLVLGRVRERMVNELPRISNYTCAETVTRRYFKSDASLATNSCDGTHTLRSWSVDRLRLDVAVTSAREVYSWPGASQFDDRDIDEIVGGGPIGAGALIEFLSGIFAGNDANIAYLGEQLADGLRVMEFGYSVPQEKSRYRIRAGSGWVIAGYEGSFRVDTDTADLMRLSIRAGELPESTGSCRTETVLDYRRVLIGGVDSLVPATTRQQFVLRTGTESENTTTFSACREYRGESTVTFLGEGAPIAALTDSGGRQPKILTLPPDLPVTMRLAAPLDTWIASAGDLIALRLAKPIVGSAKHVLVPAGAAIQARLLRVQRYFTKPERVTVVIRPETIDRDGVRLPFAEATPVAQLDFVGDHVILPKGYHTQWRTAPYLAAINP